MQFNIDKFDRAELIQTMTTMGIPCQGKIISPQSKYKGKTFTITWSCGWGITLKVQPINRNYMYTSSNVELTQKSVNEFKRRLVDQLDEAIDFFERPLKADDIIFHKGELFRILFFIKGKSDFNVAISPIVKQDCDWDDENEDEFIHLNGLKESILIDDPLLLIKI